MAEAIKDLGILASSNLGVQDGCIPNANTRRSGNHHSNLWSDDLIQSLSSNYGDSLYHECKETLISDVCKLFSNKEEEFGLLQRLWFIDAIQCLGIARYFQEQIKIELDYAYRCWNQNIIEDLNMTSLGFRVLRLNSYDVSSDVFQKFKGDKGEFIDIKPIKEYSKLESMVNLYRASELDFPGEIILKEAKVFTLAYLQAAMKEIEGIEENKTPIQMEIEYILKYPWRCRVPRWDTWNFIQILKKQNRWLVNDVYKIPNIYRQKLLDVAILDFNIIQAQHQYEVKSICTWWKHSKVINLDFFRHRHVEFYFWWACSLFEPEFSVCRISFAKLTTCLALLDDIYDTYGTIDELKPFTKALIRWDISIIEHLPDYLKNTFKFAYEIHKEIANEAEKKHGTFVHKYIHNCWESYILAYLKEAEWIASNYIPKFEEYIKNGIASSGMRVLMMHTLILMDTPLSENILEQLDFPSSKLQTLVALTTRLVDDLEDFEDEKERGEMASSMECYMKENIGSTKEHALNYITTYIESCVQELNMEFLKSSNIPNFCKNVYFNAGMRGIFFLYRFSDGITHAHQKDLQDSIMKVLVEPIIE